MFEKYQKYAKYLIGIFILTGLMLFMFALTGKYYQAKVDALQSEKKILQRENQNLQENYRTLLVESKAHEAKAIESRAKADALVAAIDQGNKSVSTIDKKYTEAVRNYETQRANIDDCSNDPVHCSELLCLELRKAGFKCDTPK